MRHARQTGFTLVELILVIVVMGLLAGIALPSLMDRQSLNEVAVTDQVRVLLRLAQKVAVTQNRDVCFMRTAADLRLVYPVGGACSLTGNPVIDPGSGDDLGSPGNIPLAAGVVITGNTAVRFNGRGQLVPNTANLAITVGGQPPWNIAKETGFVYR